METQHFAIMNEFREKIQTSTDKTQKEEIRKQMDKQKQYVLFHTKATNQTQQVQKQGKGKGSRKGREMGNRGF